MVFYAHDRKTYVEKRIHNKGRLVAGYFYKLQFHSFTKKCRNCTENFCRLLQSQGRTGLSRYCRLDIEKAQKLKQQELTKMERYQIDQEYWSKVKARYDEVCQMAQEQIIQQYQSWFEAGDIQSICTSIQSWIRFCSQDQPEVRQRRHMKWKAKKSSSIKSYWTPIKDYLRICHGIRIMAEDVKDYLKFSKDTKQEPEPLELETYQVDFGSRRTKTKGIVLCSVDFCNERGRGAVIEEKQLQDRC